MNLNYRFAWVDLQGFQSNQNLAQRIDWSFHIMIFYPAP